MYCKEGGEYIPHPRKGIPKHDIPTETNSIGTKK